MDDTSYIHLVWYYNIYIYCFMFIKFELCQLYKYISIFVYLYVYRHRGTDCKKTHVSLYIYIISYKWENTKNAVLGFMNVICYNKMNLLDGNWITSLSENPTSSTMCGTNRSLKTTAWRYIDTLALKRNGTHLTGAINRSSKTPDWRDIGAITAERTPVPAWWVQ